MNINQVRNLKIIPWTWSIKVRHATSADEKLTIKGIIVSLIIILLLFSVKLNRGTLISRRIFIF